MQTSPDTFSILVERADPNATPTHSDAREWSVRVPPADAPLKLAEENAFSIDTDYPQSGSLGWIYATFTVDRLSHVVTVSDFNDYYVGVAQLFFSVMNHGAPALPPEPIPTPQ